MNSDFLRWLLHVNAIPKGSDGLRLAWERPWPGWVWSLLFMGVALFALWSYSRLIGRRSGRGILAAARWGMLLLMLVLISGPMLELPRESVEQDWVLMLADRSASMTIKDAQENPLQKPESPRISRDAQLHNALDSQSNVLDYLAQQRHLVWMGFHFGAFNLQADDRSGPASRPLDPGAAPPQGSITKSQTESLPKLGEPTGRRTNIQGALEQALQRAAARPISGIVLFSDGRTDSPPNRALVRRLQADAIPVFVVPLGSAQPVGDLAIRRIDAPRRAFIKDKVPVQVELDRLGSAVRDLGATIKLIDQGTGELLDKMELKPGDPRDQFTLTAQPALAGQATWKVVIETAQPDLIPENNLKPFQIELVDRPLRVLFVEGYPRWEYRYVKNLLVREKSITSSVMLISADRDFAQEGNQPITRLPRSPEEFAAFDVIILGDVPATFFAPDQLEMIRDHVADRGAGLLWIAGEHATPSSYVGTALADLLPMRGSLNLPPIGEPVTMTPTPLAERLGVLRLAFGTDQVGWPQQLTDPATGWSKLFYAQKIEPGQLKPAAEILAQTTSPINGTPLPLVLNMRYGAGQSIYVATDEIWRWRYGRGDMLPDQFWVQMIRMLGRESLSNAGDPATLEVNPRRVATNQPMRIELRLLDAQLLKEQRPTIHVVLETESNQHIAEIELRKVEGTEDRYAATYLPETIGQLRLRIDEPNMPRLNMQAPVEVFSPDDELRRPETDHETLKSLAIATGGKVLAPDELNQLPSLLPNRAVRTLNPLTEPIWDSPLALGLALLLLTGEWIGRKVLRLV